MGEPYVIENENIRKFLEKSAQDNELQEKMSKIRGTRRRLTGLPAACRAASRRRSSSPR